MKINKGRKVYVVSNSLEGGFVIETATYNKAITGQGKSYIEGESGLYQPFDDDRIFKTKEGARSRLQDLKIGSLTDLSERIETNRIRNNDTGIKLTDAKLRADGINDNQKAIIKKIGYIYIFLCVLAAIEIFRFFIAVFF